MKKFFKILTAVVLLIILALLLIPYFYGDKIITYIKDDLNKSLNAQVDFDDVSLSLIRNFPFLNVKIDHLRIDGKDNFQGLRLLSADDFRLNLDAVKFFWDGETTVKGIDIDKFDLHILVDSTGQANYDIVKSGNTGNDSAGETQTYNLKINKYRIRRSHILYEDQSSGMRINLSGIDHTGSGNFTPETFLLQTDTDIQSATVQYGIKYLNGVHLHLKSPITISDDYSHYTLENPDATANGVPLHFDTFDILLKDDDIHFDLAFRSAKNALEDFLSLIPQAYQPYLKGMHATGKAALHGYVKGIYNDKHLPSFGIKADIENGSLQHATLPESIRNINVAADIKFPGGNNLNAMHIDLSHINMDLGGNPLTGNLHIATPLSDPDISAACKTKTDLSKLKNTIEMPGVRKLTGMLDADFSLKGKLSALENPGSRTFQADGFITVDGLQYESDSLPYPVSIPHAALQISPEALQVKPSEIKIEENDFQLNGNVTNYLAYFFHKDEKLHARLNLYSHAINLNDFITGESGSGNDTTTRTEETAVIRIPENLDVSANMKVDALTYKNLHLKDVKGNLQVKNGKADISSLLMKTFGGNLTLKGFYDSSKPSPESALGVKMEKLSIPESATGFSVFETYTPVLKNVRGNFFSDMNLNVKLDDKMNPDMKSLNMTGTFQTENIDVRGLNLIKKIAGLVHLKALQNPSVDNIRAHFTISKGTMDIKPFSFKLNGMQAVFGGKAGLDKKVDFVLNLDIPRDKLGNKAHAILENLVGKLDKFGIQSDALPEIIKMKFRIAGNMDHPAVTPLIAGYEGKSTGEIIQEVVQDKVEEVIEEKTEQIRADLQAKADSIMAEARRQTAALMQQAEKTAARIKSEAQKQGDKLIHNAKNPFQKLAAQATAKELNRQADKKANKLLQKTGQQADKILENARKKADKILQTPVTGK